MNVFWLYATIILARFFVKAHLNPTCNSNDSMVLQHFMNGMESPIPGWTSNSPNCCDWDGVTCAFSGKVQFQQACASTLLELEFLNLGKITLENPTCNPNDLRGLTGFMNALYSPIDGWWPANSSSSYCCNWIGVTCNSSSGRIVKLQLPDQISGGRISTSVSYLDQLTTLDLSHNFLSGPLPISLFHLTHLKELNLSGNEFNRVLPVSINLPALQVLDISDNNLRGFLPFGLCVNSSRIRVLNFASNYFTGIIPPQVGNCTFLEHLSVASNFISGIIPDFLLGLPRLHELAFQDNEFTGIGNSSSPLVHLDISSNRFSENIPDVFHNFPNLSRFVSHSNNLSGGVPPSLSNSQTISSLNLRNNSLDGPIDFNCLKMVNLVSLDLSNNNFLSTIPANLASCRKLKSLNLSRNKFMTGQIPESFKNFESLSYLSLAHCSFSNLSSSLKILQHIPNLTILVLTMNFYSEQLPSDSDLQFKTLKALVISNCRLTGSLPSWLNGLTQLQLLDLSSNHLTGSIPVNFGDFQSLFYLDLSNNSLSGGIPKCHKLRFKITAPLYSKHQTVPTKQSSSHHRLTGDTRGSTRTNRNARTLRLLTYFTCEKMRKTKNTKVQEESL
ncbi:putative non-specific serine/threonine protein kinase [Helianthus annuus]|nr:putative non-specific serine/threonine protein kinase [Helianthus annuus]